MSQGKIEIIINVPRRIKSEKTGKKMLSLEESLKRILLPLSDEETEIVIRRSFVDGKNIHIVVEGSNEIRVEAIREMIVELSTDYPVQKSITETESSS